MWKVLLSWGWKPLRRCCLRPLHFSQSEIAHPPLSWSYSWSVARVGTLPAFAMRWVWNPFSARVTPSLVSSLPKRTAFHSPCLLSGVREKKTCHQVPRQNVSSLASKPRRFAVIARVCVTYPHALRLIFKYFTHCVIMKEHSVYYTPSIALNVSFIFSLHLLSHFVDPGKQCVLLCTRQLLALHTSV